MSGVAPIERGMESAVSIKDPLDRIIKIAHKNGIEVHPWFCVVLRQRDFLHDYYDPVKTPQKAFDIHRPEFQQFIVNLISDVVRRYDIDGVNMDYIRSMGVCTCPYCKRQYKDNYQKDLTEDITQSGNMVRLEPNLQQWQDTALESIVRQVSAMAKKLKPSLVLSVCGKPRLPSEPVNPQGRQEIRWANKSLIDLIYCMDYKIQPDFDRHESVKNLVKEPAKAIPLLSNYDKDFRNRILPRDPQVLANLISAARRRWDDGFGLYLYSQFNNEQLGAIVRLGLEQ